MKRVMISTRHQQQTCEGCLAVDLMRMAGLPSDMNTEIQILSTGFALFKSSYAVAICLGFALEYNRRVIVTIESPQFVAKLQKDIQGVRGSELIEIRQGIVNTATLQTARLPYIVYVDSHVFSGTYEHGPHFVCVEGRHGKDALTILDPATGIIKEYPVKSVMASVRSLRNVVRFSPLIIQLQDKVGVNSL